MNDADLVEQWCNSMTTAGKSPNTIKRRRLTLDRFTRGHDLATATPAQIEAWMASMPIKPQSRGLYLADLRALYRWALRLDHLEKDPTIKVDAPKRPRYVPRPIPTRALKAAIAAAPPRDRVMLTLAGYAGLRAAEIAALRCEDFDHETKSLRVTGKGDKPRIVKMHKFVAELVGPDTTGPVVSWRGKPITAATVSGRLATYLDSVGLDATGHQARHSYGTRMYAASKDLVLVQKLMGHESPLTTGGYVQHDAAMAQAATDMLD